MTYRQNLTAALPSVAPEHAPSYPLAAVPDRAAARSTRVLHVVAEVARYLGACSLLVVGAIHAQQYYEAYFYEVPTIGRLFLLSFVGAAVVGAILLAPVRRLAGGWGDPILVVAALGGIGIAVGTFVSLLVSEYTPVFGFMEADYRLAVVLALVFDVLTTALLGLFVALVGPDVVRDLRARRRTRGSVARDPARG
jgi:hypothetical protein